MEGLAAAGAASSIIQIVDFGTKVCKRIIEYSSACRELPEAFKHVNAQLPLVAIALERIGQVAKTRGVTEAEARVLFEVLEACTKEVQGLQDVVLQVLPGVNDGGFKRTVKAVGSLRWDDTVKRKGEVIQSYVRTLELALASLGVGGNVEVTKVDASVPRAVGLFRRDPNFVHRQILQDIIECSKDQGSRLALVGIGGMGKSQLSIQFAHHVRDTSSDTWVFWIHAETAAKFEESYRTIAKAIGVSTVGLMPPDVLKEVYDWLNNEKNGKWVMIVDNADDMEVWTSAPLITTNGPNQPTPTTPPPSLLSLLPESRNGTILITSRTREVARLLTGSYTQIMQVDQMLEVEAIELFSKKAGHDHDTAQVAHLVRKLDYIPLAVSQAASYIAERAGRMSVQRYIDELSTLDQAALGLLEMSCDESHREKERSNSVVKTWIITFQHIQRTRSSAARLLSLMSLFDRHAIPEDLLIGSYTVQAPVPPCKPPSWWRKPRLRRSRSKPKPAPSSPPDAFDTDWLVLRDFSLIQTSTCGTRFSMHALVRATTQRWLAAQNSLAHWTTRYIALLGAAYPWPQDSAAAWAACDALFAHAHAALAYTSADLCTYGALMQNASVYAYEGGLFADAEALTRAAMGAWSRALGAEHENVLGLRSNLGCVLLSRGRLAEAEEVQRAVLAVRERERGEADLVTLKSVYVVGTVLYSQARFAEAEGMFRRALEGREKAEGSTGRDARLAGIKLMSALQAQGREAEAEEVLVRCFPAEEKEGS